MVITKKLDIDKDIEFLESGTMCHASNVVVNMTNNGILSENAIEEQITLLDNETVVGYIAASEEFIIFTNKNRIIRVNAETYSQTIVQTNWRWGGGKVIGCYTYNANQELIVSISEQIDYNETKVPLKIINLDKPNYKEGDDDDKYTLAPEIPMTNLLSYEYINGNNIYKGVYCFYIRYKIGTDYTSWFKLGYPINIYNKNHKETIFEGRYGYFDRQSVGDSSYKDEATVVTYGFSDYCDDAAINISQNIRLIIDIQLTSIEYEKYQIGYIVNDVENNTHVFTTIDYDINNKFVIIDNKNNDEVSVDEITRDAFQIYNAKTLCNYGNRIYLANYNEENLNKEVENIDVSSIKVSAVEYSTNILSKKSINTNNVNTNNNGVSLLSTKDVTTNVVDPNKVENPETFKIGKAYYIELYFNCRDNENQYPLNLKFFCTRLAVFKSEYFIPIKISDILHAAAAYLSKDTYNTNITFNVSYNSSLIKESTFIYISPYKNGIYDIEFDSSGNTKYTNAYTEALTINSTYATGSGIDVTKPCIGRKNDVISRLIDGQKADIEYNVPVSANYTGDLFVTRIVEFDTTYDALSTIELNWFYNGKFIIDEKEYSTHGAYSSNYIISNPYYSSIPIIDDSDNIINYKARKAFNFNIINDTNLIYNKILSLFPNSTYKFLRYCITEDGTESNSENADLIVDINPNEENYNKSQLLLGYDKINKKYNLIRVGWNNYGADRYYILQNTFYVINSNSEQTKHTLDELFNNITYNEDRKDKTLDELIDYWNGETGGDVGYITTYEWREDRNPNETEWSLDEQYNIEWGKKVYSTSSKNADILNRIYGLTVKAVGYQNITEDDELHKVIVDKDFALVIPVYDLYLQLGGDSSFSKYSNVALYKNDINNKLKEGSFANFYVLFRKQDILDYNNTQIISGNVCYLREETDINSNVPIFDKYYDFSFDISNTDTQYTFPCFTKSGYTTSIIEKALFYINRYTVGDEDLDDAIASSEYEKTAISNAVYNFFIHFVYPNGNYTSGIRIPNNRTYYLKIPVATGVIRTSSGSSAKETFSYECNDNTTVANVKNAFLTWKETNAATDIEYDETYCVYRFFDSQDNLRICNLYPVFDDTGISVYINSNGDKLFRGYPKNKEKVSFLKENYSIKFVFDNIPKIDGFVGYFISYEKPEHILIGTGPIIPYNADFNTEYNNSYKECRFYYPEFNILKKAGGINTLIIKELPIGGEAKIGPTFTDFYDVVADRSYSSVSPNAVYSGVNSSEIIIPNDASNDNGGKEGVLKLKLNDSLLLRSIALKYLYHTTDETGYLYLTQAIGLFITDNLYLNENKELISLGLIKYYNDDETNNTYGYDDYPYNYDYYKSNASVYAFHNRGVVFDEVESIPKFFDDNTNVYPNYPIIDKNIFNTDWRQGCSPICRYNYDIFCEVDLEAKQVDNAPIEKYYTLKQEEDDTEGNNEDIVNIRTVYVYPLYINDLFKIASCYQTFTDKIIINLNKDLFYNFITYYGKTIRRSDVISDESIENRWRVFRAEEYKIIKENKGNIINVVGIGIYLMAHCEHSLFIFNRDNTMRTNDKDVQLLIPDAFEIDYSEVFTSDKGYAGLQEFNQWCISNYGYIFFDKDSKKIYRFDNTNLTDITPGMMNLFKFVDDIKFAIDDINERLICIGTIDKEINNKFTISYSFLAKDWVSTHSYWYNDLFNTKNKVFFILTNNTSTIHTFTDKFNNYSNIITDDTNVFKTELIENNPSSFIDVVFNNNGIDKVLDYISYCINKSTDDNYSGDKLLIYTNICYSDYIDISKSRKSVTDYKNPVFRFGIWIYNWFRNKILKINTINPIIRGNGKFALTNNDLGKGVDNALIIGKWFVIRLIFRDNEKRININDIQTY